MYTCQMTGKIVGPNIPIHRIITKTRDREYLTPIYERSPKHKEGRGRVVDHKISHGTEIVEELVVCPEVFEKHTGEKALASRLPEKQKKPYRNRERQEESDRMRQKRRRG